MSNAKNEEKISPTRALFTDWPPITTLRREENREQNRTETETEGAKRLANNVKSS